MINVSSLLKLNDITYIYWHYKRLMVREQIYDKCFPVLGELVDYFKNYLLLKTTSYMIFVLSRLHHSKRWKSTFCYPYSYYGSWRNKQRYNDLAPL